MSVTYIPGQQHTGNINQDERRIEIHPKMIYVDANMTPLLHIAMGKNQRGLPAKKMSVVNPEYKILSKQPRAEFTAVNAAAGFTPTQNLWTVDSTGFMTVNDIFQLIGIDEQVRVLTIPSGTTLTVAREQGTTSSPASVPDDTPMYRLGNAREEYGSLGPAIGVLAVTGINYTHIIDRVTSYSGTLQNSAMVYGKKPADLIKESWIDIKKDLEKTFLFGEPFEDLTGGPNGNPIRKTGGIRYWINTVGNIQTGTTFTEAIWETYIQDLFLIHDQPWKVVLASPLLITAIGRYQKDNLRFRPTDNLGGMWAAQIDSGHGTVFVMRDQMLKDTALGSGGGYGGMLIGFEPNQIGYRYLQNRDLALYENQQNPGDDGQADKYLGEVGFYMERPENARIAEGYTAFA